MRVHLQQCSMTFAEADEIQEYLRKLPGVISAKVSERTCNAVIRYMGTGPERKAIIRALSRFAYGEMSVRVPDHTGRELQHQYEDRMFWHVVRHLVKRLFLPAPVRMVISTVKAVPFVCRAFTSLRAGKLDVHVLDAASVTIAVLRGDFDTAGSVMFLLGVGDIMEEWTHKKSVDDLANAMSLHVSKVWLKTPDGQEVLTRVDRVGKDDRIVVRTGNVIPLDGIVEAGDGMVNQASITGEPLPVHKSEGAALFAGTVVEEGELTVRVTRSAGSGQYDKIVAMIEESEKLKSDTETKASSLADRLVPFTFALTGLTWLFTRNVTKAYSILMVDFCCALKLSMPVAVLSAMREAGSNNISVKGGKMMENYASAETIIFDKTGTLTMATPRVQEVVAFGGRDPREMLRLAACLEEHYPHSIANAVVREAKNQGLVHEEKHTRVQYIVAHGIASEIDGTEVRIGSYHFIFEDEGTAIPEGEQAKFDALPEEYSHLYMAVAGELAAVILIADPVRENAADVICALHNSGFRRVVMLTGDSERTAAAVAAKLGIDDYRSEVLPEDKAAYIAQEHAAGRKVVMIGDGINDSPALSAADVGVAINSGADIAREIADVTISGDDLMALITLRQISEGLARRTKGNYRTILGFNSSLIVLAMLGILSPSMTALLHNTSTILIGLHSMTNLLPEDQTVQRFARMALEN
jgi:heavy metal translocating P-type ATPase